MTPYEHSLLSVRDHGGHWEDYLHVHEFLDQSKALCPDFRHRALLHHSGAIPIVEEAVGKVVWVGPERGVPTRVLVMEHIAQDCSCVPTFKEVLDSLSKGEYNKVYNRPNKKDLEWLKKNN